MSIYSLYIKTHNKTGFKYLGHTIKDPFIYQGSGKHWRLHIKKHGYDVTTEILGQFETPETLKVAGIFYSKFHNVVDSENWANLIEEHGIGGGGPRSLEARMKMSLAAKGKKKSPEAISKMAKTKLGNKNRLGKKHSIETREKIRNSSLKQWDEGRCWTTRLPPEP